MQGSAGHRRTLGFMGSGGYTGPGYEVLGLIYATSSFYTAAQRCAAALTGVPVTEEQRERMLGELGRVRAAAGWLEHAISTGDTAITPAAVAAGLKQPRRQPDR